MCWSTIKQRKNISNVYIIENQLRFLLYVLFVIEISTKVELPTLQLYVQEFHTSLPPQYNGGRRRGFRGYGWHTPASHTLGPSVPGKNKTKAVVFIIFKVGVSRSMYGIDLIIVNYVIGSSELERNTQTYSQYITHPCNAIR